MVEEAPADIPSLLELKRIYYELMIRYMGAFSHFTISLYVFPAIGYVSMIILRSLSRVSRCLSLSFFSSIFFFKIIVLCNSLPSIVEFLMIRYGVKCRMGKNSLDHQYIGFAYFCFVMMDILWQHFEASIFSDNAKHRTKREFLSINFLSSYQRKFLISFGLALCLICFVHARIIVSLSGFWRFCNLVPTFSSRIFQFSLSQFKCATSELFLLLVFILTLKSFQYKVSLVYDCYNFIHYLIWDKACVL